MFTGLIESTARLKSITPKGNYRVFTLEKFSFEEPLVKGESIACDGACLTVVSFNKSEFSVEASQESLAVTIMNKYRTGSMINLERALKFSSRLGGHLVSGHIDCVGKIDFLKPIGESLEIGIKFDTDFDRYVIAKGSIAINGISLTVNEVRPGFLSVNIIPHTATETTITNWSAGDEVNLEFDMIGKYLFKMLRNKDKKELTIDKLIESGW